METINQEILTENTKVHTNIEIIMKWKELEQLKIISEKQEMNIPQLVAYFIKDGVRKLKKLNLA